MVNNNMNIISKIFLIVAVVFCGISLIIPWASWAGVGNIGYYTWGANIANEWDFFYTDALTSGVTESIVFGVSMIIAFIITIIALIVGAIGIKNIGIKKSKSPLIGGILSIVAIIFCIIAVSQFSSNIIGFSMGYGIGFFLMIISCIMFFVAYGVAVFTISSIPMAPAPVPQQMYYQQQPTNQQMNQPPVQQTQQQQAPPPVTPPPPSQQSQPAQQQPVQQTPQQPPAQQQPTVTPKFCPECGTKLLENAQICHMCGKKVI